MLNILIKRRKSDTLQDIVLFVKRFKVNVHHQIRTISPPDKHKKNTAWQICD